MRRRAFLIAVLTLGAAASLSAQGVGVDKLKAVAKGTQVILSYDAVTAKSVKLDDYAPQLFASQDGGASWIAIVAGLEQGTPASGATRTLTWTPAKTGIPGLSLTAKSLSFMVRYFHKQAIVHGLGGPFSSLSALAPKAALGAKSKLDAADMAALNAGLTAPSAAPALAESVAAVDDKKGNIEFTYSVKAPSAASLADYRPFLMVSFDDGASYHLVQTGLDAAASKPPAIGKNKLSWSPAKSRELAAFAQNKPIAYRICVADSPAGYQPQVAKLPAPVLKPASGTSGSALGRISGTPPPNASRTGVGEAPAEESPAQETPAEEPPAVETPVAESPPPPPPPPPLTWIEEVKASLDARRALHADSVIANPQPGAPPLDPVIAPLVLYGSAALDITAHEMRRFRREGDGKPVVDLVMSVANKSASPLRVEFSRYEGLSLRYEYLDVATGTRKSSSSVNMGMWWLDTGMATSYYALDIPPRTTMWGHRFYQNTPETLVALTGLGFSVVVGGTSVNQVFPSLPVHPERWAIPDVPYIEELVIPATWPASAEFHRTRTRGRSQLPAAAQPGPESVPNAVIGQSLTVDGFLVTLRSFERYWVTIGMNERAARIRMLVSVQNTTQAAKNFSIVQDGAQLRTQNYVDVARQQGQVARGFVASGIWWDDVSLNSGSVQFPANAQLYGSVFYTGNEIDGIRFPQRFDLEISDRKLFSFNLESSSIGIVNDERWDPIPNP